MPLKHLKRAWTGLNDQRTRLIEEYGLIAVGTLFALSLPIYAGFFYVRWRDGTLAGFGFVKTAGIAWAATRATLPIRLAIALVLTPFVAKLVHRFRKPAPKP